MRVRVYPYKQGSRSAAALSSAIGGLRLKRERSRFRPRASDIIINWGSGSLPDEFRVATVLNSPHAVNTASNKVSFFRQMQDVGEVHTPEFTTDIAIAEQWIREQGWAVVCRTLTRANSGRGIVIATEVDHLVPAPLYTRYIKKQEEYRLHVFRDNVIDVQRKARRRDVPDEDVNWQVRNHSNGFIFAREGVSVDDDARAQAVAAVAGLGLDFGAVDMLYNRRHNQYYVLEVNTAPGLEGTTLDRYREAILNV